MRKFACTVVGAGIQSAAVSAKIEGTDQVVEATVPVLVVETITAEGFNYTFRMTNPTDKEKETFVEGASVVVSVDVAKG